MKTLIYVSDTPIGTAYTQMELIHNEKGSKSQLSQGETIIFNNQPDKICVKVLQPEDISLGDVYLHRFFKTDKDYFDKFLKLSKKYQKSFLEYSLQDWKQKSKISIDLNEFAKLSNEFQANALAIENQKMPEIVWV